MDFPARCRRTGTPNWRCPEKAMEGKSYCEKHYLYSVSLQKLKKEKAISSINGEVSISMASLIEPYKPVIDFGSEKNPGLTSFDPGLIGFEPGLISFDPGLIEPYKPVIDFVVNDGQLSSSQSQRSENVGGSQSVPAWSGGEPDFESNWVFMGSVNDGITLGDNGEVGFERDGFEVGNDLNALRGCGLIEPGLDGRNWMDSGGNDYNTLEVEEMVGQSEGQKRKRAIMLKKKLQDELEKIGNKMKQHEDNLKFLKTQRNQLDNAILELQVSIGKYISSSGPKTEDDNTSQVRSEEEIIKQILKHENSAASIYCQVKGQHDSHLQNLTLCEDILGVVALLGRVEDDNLSRLLSDFLGLETMLGIVCKTYEGIKGLELYDGEGLVNKGSGIHDLGASIGRSLRGRFPVICLECLRPYTGEFLSNDPQRKLDIPKPRLPTGDTPNGFLGYAVNMINIEGTRLFGLTSSGSGLRETLFYNIFSRLQVYRTRAEMLLALPFITDGAISLDGGMIKSSGVFSLGTREDIEVKFPKCSKIASLSEEYYELDNQIKEKKWEKEEIQDDIRREQAMLDQQKYNFSLRKQDFLKFLADSTSFGQLFFCHSATNSGSCYAKQTGSSVMRGPQVK